uniref:CX domain-containing protein n=1 Tax=Panagrolaimus sp. ES5 TaxID=591445 RepID=A0AC34GUW8_9BILA
MDYFSILRRLWLSLLILFVYFDQVGCKRGGISIGRSRGASGARGRGGSGGIFGGYKSGNTGGSSGGWNQGSKSHIGSSGGTNFQGSRPNYKSQGHGGYGSSGGSSGFGRSSGPKYSKSGVGSFVRSNQFKNAIVGAAAGYLTYQAGKAIIRNVMAPMMWNNRPYYWGSSYYPRSSMGGQGQMCRMPVDNTDTQLSNIYLPDNTRPREIVWGCGYNEYCCGYECCRGNGASGYGRYGTGFGIGCEIFTILILTRLLRW